MIIENKEQGIRLEFPDDVKYIALRITPCNNDRRTKIRLDGNFDTFYGYDGEKRIAGCFVDLRAIKEISLLSDEETLGFNENKRQMARKEWELDEEQRKNDMKMEVPIDDHEALFPPEL